MTSDPSVNEQPPQAQGARVVRWPLGHEHSACSALHNTRALTEALRHAGAGGPWVWPRRRVIFVADPHADTEAFAASLAASGGVRRRGAEGLDFELTEMGRDAEFIIGGDCLDKGPSDLATLRTLRHLIDSGARVALLAGNHDVRLLMGLRAMGAKGDPTTEHLFVRMGSKVVPLLKEVYETYLGGAEPGSSVPDEIECRRRLYPSPQWFDAFPRVVAERLPAAMVDREVERMRGKLEAFGEDCAAAGLSMRQVYSAALHCRRLFVDEDGEFAWFFRDMELLRRHGSILFVHAGIDDGIVAMLDEHGIDAINRRFHWLIENDLFGLYYGSLGNCMRTKYRDVNLPLTARGAATVRELGLHIIVHGHHNRTGGQRLALRQGIMHVESDVTLDRASRRQEGLTGPGVGVTLVDPNGFIDGLSADYPDVKRLEPAVYLGHKDRQTHAA